MDAMTAFPAWIFPAEIAAIVFMLFRSLPIGIHHSIMHINPDHFLQTENGRVITEELNKLAWEKSFAALDEALRVAGPSTKVYVLVGPQGAGKSTWAKAMYPTLGNPIIFDAILVKVAERLPIVSSAKAHSLGVIAVFFKTPLELCLSRNAGRPADEVVPERNVRNVHSAIEPPTIAEGFEKIIEVTV
jgi:hypothetical protein